MLKRAKSAFTSERRDAGPIEWEGGQMSRTQWVKTFTGDLSGDSTVEAIMAGLDNGGPSIYVGIERIRGELNGLQGSFVLLHAASMHGGVQTTAWTIVPGSGTGDLAGIRGRGEILPGHEFVLEYEIEG